MFKLTPLVLAMLLVGCSESDPTTTTPEIPSTTFNVDDNISVVEGEVIEINVETTDDVLSVSADDVDNLLIDVNNTNTGINIVLYVGYDSHPIFSHTRTFTITGANSVNTFDVLIAPTSRPDVYLLAGQSNMVGYPDEPAGPDDVSDPRLLQLNVTSNDSNPWTTAAEHSSVDNNVGVPSIIVAENPLHEPNKNGNTIGPGMTFGKAALAHTTADVILVPTAMGSTAFCNYTAPAGQWNASLNQSGNSWLFDRAVTRTNAALSETGGILRGIIWHQGESDSDEQDCADAYVDNLTNMVTGFRTTIQPDPSGSHEDVPFVVGTMSRGTDYEEFSDTKQQVDDAHKSVSTYIPLSSVANFDDLIPSNGYPCGQNGDCIHYGNAALQEMGRRYFAVLNELN